MVVVTTGTNEQPFDRLVRAAANLGLDEPVVVQYGSSRAGPPPEHARAAGDEWIDFLSFDELAERIRAARVVVCHAGVGSIVLARRCGKRPLVVPRRLHLGEAVDDHQLPLARRLHAGGLVTLVEEERLLAPAIRATDGLSAAAGMARLPGADALGRDVRGLLEELGVRRAPATGARAQALSVAARARRGTW